MDPLAPIPRNSLGTFLRSLLTLLSASPGRSRAQRFSSIGHRRGLGTSPTPRVHNPLWQVGSLGAQGRKVPEKRRCCFKPRQHLPPRCPLTLQGTPHGWPHATSSFAPRQGLQAPPTFTKRLLHASPVHEMSGEPRPPGHWLKLAGQPCSGAGCGLRHPPEGGPLGPFSAPPLNELWLHEGCPTDSGTWGPIVTESPAAILSRLQVVTAVAPSSPVHV